MGLFRRTICVVPGLTGLLLLMSVTPMLGQQKDQNPPPSAPSANRQSQNSQQSSGRTKKASGKGIPAAPVPNNPAVSNPFPMAQSEAAAKADAQGNRQTTAPMQDNSSASSSSSNSTKAAANSGQGQGKSSAAQKNPFPEAQSEAAAKGDQGSAAGSGKPQAGSSSSTGGYSSSNAQLPATDLGEGNPSKHQRMDTYTRDHTLDGRIQDDLNVADFYMKNGNYHGGYLRYQDALQYDPQNDTAMYGLAEAMCKENLTSEAMAQFKSYLANSLQGKYAKKAEKMLEHPEKCEHNR